MTNYAEKASEQVDDSPWPAVVVLLSIVALLAFIAWLTLGGDCG